MENRTETCYECKAENYLAGERKPCLRSSASRFACGLRNLPGRCTVQGLQSPAAVGRYAPHLLDHNFGIRVDLKRFGLQGLSTLQGFQQDNILGHIVMMAPNPLGDRNPASSKPLQNQTGRRCRQHATGSFRSQAV